MDAQLGPWSWRPAAHPDRMIPPTRIAAAVADRLEVSRTAIFGSRRTAEIALARQVSMVLIRRQTGRSFYASGRFFGRDHSTVQHGVREIDARLQRAPALRALVDAAAAQAAQPNPEKGVSA